MPGADEDAVMLERAQVVAVGSQADVSVGAHRNERDALNAKEISRDGFEVSDMVGQIVMRAESEGRFEQWRVGYDLLHRGEEIREFGTSRGRAAEQYQGVAGAMGELVKTTGSPARRLNRDRVG